MAAVPPAPDSLLANFQSYLEEFAKNALDDHTRGIRRLDGRGADKEINDPIWYTIRVRPLELLIVDSPLFQRLRGIRQLGVVHWVFPGATHTRFDHSLGVLSRVQDLIDSINRSASESDVPIVGKSLTQILRLAALCHDLGHGFMSHVSENVVSAFPEIRQMRAQFTKRQDLENIQLGEMAAYYLVGSPAFQHLLQTAQNLGYLEAGSTVKSLVEGIGNAIIGRPISHRIPLLHELISGPFDADKLDYMTRDARQTGVPVVTDITRMTQKVRAINLPRDAVPKEIARLVKGDEASYWLTGIDLSGGRALDELMFGRALLFDKIYRHHKVRAIEGMVALFIHHLNSALSQPVFVLPYSFSDEQILGLAPDYFDFSNYDASDRKPDGDSALQIACELSTRLRARRLFARAFAFALHTPQDSYRQSREQRSGLEAIIRESGKFSERLKIIAGIAAETRTILDELSLTIPGLDSDPSLESALWIDPPRYPEAETQISRALLITKDRKVIRFRDDSPEIRGWSDAYLQANDIGYVFCVRELAPYVYLATEKYFLEKYKVSMDSVVFSYAHQNESEVNEVRARLAQAGFYRTSPRRLLPEPKRLTRADVPDICKDVCENFQAYDGPEIIGAVDRSERHPLNEMRLRNWLKQFQDDDLVEVGLQLLQSIRLIGRHDCRMALRKFLDAHPEFKGAAVANLGSARDSGAILTYYANDLLPKLGLHALDLPLALRSGRPVIFLDDITGSGRQYVNTLRERLGLEAKFDLKEEPRSALQPEEQRFLRERKLAFVFTTALDEGLALIRKELVELELAIHVEADIPEGELPVLQSLSTTRFLAAFPERHQRFIERAAEIGRSLLYDPTKGHDEAWCEDRALGYGNRGLLISFPYNTPAQTLTCLWSAGKYLGAPWEPLVPRRKKD